MADGEMRTNNGGTEGRGRRQGLKQTPAILSSGRTGRRRETKQHSPRFRKQGSLILPAQGSVPGAELDAEFSVASCGPSIFSLFSTCFFSVRVLEGSTGSRGR